MVEVLFDECRMAFTDDINAARTKIWQSLTEQHPNITFDHRTEKQFWSPEPNDMSAVIKVYFPANQLPPTDFERTVLTNLHTIAGKKQKPVIELDSISSTKLATYKFLFSCKKEDYHEPLMEKITAKQI
jgi:hypothetical protein